MEENLTENSIEEDRVKDRPKHLRNNTNKLISDYQSHNIIEEEHKYQQALFSCFDFLFHPNHLKIVFFSVTKPQM